MSALVAKFRESQNLEIRYVPESSYKNRQKVRKFVVPEDSPIRRQELCQTVWHIFAFHPTLSSTLGYILAAWESLAAWDPRAPRLPTLVAQTTKSNVLCQNAFIVTINVFHSLYGQLVPWGMTNVQLIFLVYSLGRYQWLMYKNWPNMEAPNSGHFSCIF